MRKTFGITYALSIASAMWTFWGCLESQAQTVTNKTSGEVAVSFFVADFNWKEHLANGMSIEESGPLFGISLDGSASFPSPWKFYYRAQLYAGSVDYDGFIISIDGEITPYESDTFYVGTAGDLDASFNLSTADAIEIRPFAGAGSRYWLRSLDNNDGYGYDEYWLTMYGRLGIRIHVHTKNHYEWYIAGALTAPFYNYEWAVDVPLAEDDVELEPKEKPGYYAEAGLTTPKIAAAIFFEQLNFDESDVDDSGMFFQPESEMRVIGLRVGIPL